MCNDVNAQLNEGKIRKIVIDPGHGGKAPGACGRIYMEKDIVLGVALRLSRLIEENLSNVEVICTRKKDIFLELWERTEIANKAHADLFISIHANASKNTNVQGYETWVMGEHKVDANLEVFQRENAEVDKYEKGSDKYEGFDPNSPESYMIFSLMQNLYLRESIEMASLVQDEMGNNRTSVTNRGVHQAGFLVLWRTTMPSILVELGFMSNITEEQEMGDPIIQQQMAEALFKAIVRYKNRVENRTNISLSSNASVDTSGVKTDSLVINKKD